MKEEEGPGQGWRRESDGKEDGEGGSEIESRRGRKRPAGFLLFFYFYFFFMLRQTDYVDTH